MRDTFKRAVLALVLLGVIALASDLLAKSAYCADCTRNGSVDLQCSDQSNEDWEDCCRSFGCGTTWAINYCINRSKDTYNGCVILHACPSLAY